MAKPAAPMPSTVSAVRPTALVTALGFVST